MASAITGGLGAYLTRKREARARIVERVRGGASEPIPISARVRVAGVSGVRQIHLRGHEVISDSAADYAGYDLGPTSPELQLGVLGSCLAHTLLIHASERGVTLDAVDVEVSATLDPRSGITGFDVPHQPADVSYALTVTSAADPADVDALVRHVDEVCPILNLLRLPAVVNAEFHVVGSASAEVD